jgi:hypothetical protein
VQNRVRVPFRGEIRETTAGRIAVSTKFSRKIFLSKHSNDQQAAGHGNELGLPKVRPGKTAEIADDLKT